MTPPHGEPSHAVRRLDPLAGEWTIEAFGEVGGRAAFEWLPGGHFLIQRWSVELPEAPDGIAILGENRDGELVQAYFDTRGVERTYSLSLEDGVWRLSRADPDFSQRFEGHFSSDGDRIDAAWEKAMDGVSWEHDFEMIYRRVG